MAFSFPVPLWPPRSCLSHTAAVPPTGKVSFVRLGKSLAAGSPPGTGLPRFSQRGPVPVLILGFTSGNASRLAATYRRVAYFRRAGARVGAGSA
ncbi:hypothetical protein ARTHRO9AX_190073 [Arthrobacter sp. 9AX]|nr:hypothetical protein ARTHRO9AX_190073 [Arthrobacter sp. 9AX]